VNYQAWRWIRGAGGHGAAEEPEVWFRRRSASRPHLPLRSARARGEAMEGAVMISREVFSQFSRNRLDGEPVPKDLTILLPHRDELAERTGIRLEWAEGWAPWLETSDRSQTECRDPDVIANIRAIEE